MTISWQDDQLVPPMTETEEELALAAIQALRALQQELLAKYGAPAFAILSWELLHEA